ncbi:MAG: glycosyltransferase family 2 protein [Ferruginibacter sp.]
MDTTSTFTYKNVINREVPAVAIVILNWNGKAFLSKFLPGVLQSSYPNKRVIVADNASTDDSIAFLQQHFPQVEIIINESNQGFAKGYNSALKKVSSDYYVLLNSDVEVANDWIEPVIELMESDKRIASCQPKILSYHKKGFFEYAGASGGWIDKFGYPFARGRVFETCEEDKNQYDDAAPCFWATGAAMFVKAQVFHELGGFDEYFFAHQEEIDLCWRMHAAGYAVYVQPASVVYHVGGGTLPQGNSRKTYLNYRNNMIMLHKNLPMAKKTWVIPMRIMLNGIAAVKGILGGDPGYLFAIAKAHRHYIGWVLTEKKTASIKKTNLGKTPGFYKGNLLWDYFIKKKKTFSEIVGSK